MLTHGIQYDTPLALFDTPNSIFRSLCEKKVSFVVIWIGATVSTEASIGFAPRGSFEDPS